MVGKEFYVGGIQCGSISANSLRDMSLIRIKIDLSDKYFYLTYFLNIRMNNDE